MAYRDYDNEKVAKFMNYERILFRIDLFILGIGVLLLTFFLMVIERIKNVQDLFVFIVYFGMLLPAIKFLISIFRVLKYFFKIREEEDGVSIWRSGLSLLISPLSFAVYWFIFFILAIASCSVSA